MQLLFHRYGTTVPIFSSKSTVQWNREVVKEKTLFLFIRGAFMLFIGLIRYKDEKNAPKIVEALNVFTTE
jgi:hypothetical protein